MLVTKNVIVGASFIFYTQRFKDSCNGQQNNGASMLQRGMPVHSHQEGARHTSVETHAHGMGCESLSVSFMHHVGEMQSNISRPIVTNLIVSMHPTCDFQLFNS